jgi:hypothetical protein
MNTSQQHQELCELLPFFANGTLHDDERARVAAHLNVCLVCRAELAREYELIHQFRSGANAQRVADDGFERVMSRVRSDASQNVVPTIGSKRRWSGHGLALAAVMAGIVFGITQLYSATTKVSGQRFHTLSQARSQTVGADIVYVVFRPTASVSAINAALAAVDGDVVTGPNRDRVLTVRVPAASVTAAVDKLKARPEIHFVAAAAPATNSPGSGP